MLQRLPSLMEAHNEAMELSNRRALQINAQHPQRAGAGRMGRKKMDMDNTRLAEDSDSDHEGNLKGGNIAPEQRLKRLVGRGKKPSAKKMEEIGEKSLSLHKAEHDAMGDDEAHLQGGMLSRHLREKYGDEHAHLFGSGFLSDLGIPVVSELAGLFGLGKGDPHAVGEELARHLQGSGFWSDFADGFKNGFSAVMKPALAVGSLLPGQIGMASRLGSAGLGALGMGHTGGRKVRMRGGAVDMTSGAVDTGRVANPPPSFQRNSVGMGRHRVPAVAGGAYIDGGNVGATGGAHTGGAHTGGAHTGGAHTGGRKKRAPASAFDARRARGQAVSRLMKEKGMSLGEASRYVKEHGY